MILRHLVTPFAIQCVAVCCSVLQCVAPIFLMRATMGWLRLVGQLKIYIYIYVCLQNTCLFCRAFALETYIFKHPTNRSHPIAFSLWGGYGVQFARSLQHTEAHCNTLYCERTKGYGVQSARYSAHVYSHQNNTYTCVLLSIHTRTFMSVHRCAVCTLEHTHTHICVRIQPCVLLSIHTHSKTCVLSCRCVCIYVFMYLCIYIHTEKKTHGRAARVIQIGLF